MRISFLEWLCIFAIGAAMVELHDDHRLTRPGMEPPTAVGGAAKTAPAARPTCAWVQPLYRHFADFPGGAVRFAVESPQDDRNSRATLPYDPPGPGGRRVCNRSPHAPRGRA